MTNARVIENPATLYAEPSVNTPVLELPVGGELQLGGVKNAGGRQWVAVALPDGRKGFLPGETKVFAPKPATLLQDEVVVFVRPSADSGAVVRLQKNAQLNLIDQVKGDGGPGSRSEMRLGMRDSLRGTLGSRRAWREQIRTRKSPKKTWEWGPCCA